MIGRQELRTYGPLVIVFLIGVIITGNYFIDSPFGDSLEKNASDLAGIVVGFSTFVGLTAMVRRHILLSMGGEKRIEMRALSVWRVVLSIITVIGGILLGVEGSVFQFVYNTFIYPPRTAIYVLYMFSMTYAIYKGVVMRDVKSLFFAGAIIVMALYNAPFAITVIPGLKNFGDWMLKIGIVTGTRATTIGVGVGMTITGIRIILGQQSGILRERVEEE